ncbi:hypothetical protein T484DRAFT_1962147 [Baffinella frigidus]|nr:hypothetical protein T484DRAFT_1962147 [Cryptophyta sp. CCMP2293]
MRNSASDAPGCSHCGTQGVSLLLCARCMHASYCGAACQKAAWKEHKQNTCSPVNTGAAAPMPGPNMMAVLAGQAAASCGNPACPVGKIDVSGKVGRGAQEVSTLPADSLLLCCLSESGLETTQADVHDAAASRRGA